MKVNGIITFTDKEAGFQVFIDVKEIAILEVRKQVGRPITKYSEPTYDPVAREYVEQSQPKSEEDQVCYEFTIHLKSGYCYETEGTSSHYHSLVSILRAVHDKNAIEVAEQELTPKVAAG